MKLKQMVKNVVETKRIQKYKDDKIKVVIYPTDNKAGTQTIDMKDLVKFIKETTKKRNAVFIYNQQSYVIMVEKI